MFTAVAALQLIERGKLSLDGTIGQYLPNYPNKEIAGKVTVRHLLTHSGGTGDIFGPEFEKNRLLLKEQGALSYYGHGGGAPGMNGELRVYPQLGYVVVGLSNLDPPAASRLVEYFAVRMPAE
jgi:CubicO group peptidase (beta-lactamase class C family)